MVAAGLAYHKRMERIRKLTGWLNVIPPRWDYAEPDIIYGQTYHYRHGLGHIAMCFWSDILEVLTDEHQPDQSARALAGQAFYNACDGLAFHYFDDAYV